MIFNFADLKDLPDSGCYSALKDSHQLVIVRIFHGWRSVLLLAQPKKNTFQRHNSITIGLIIPAGMVLLEPTQPARKDQMD